MCAAGSGVRTQFLLVARRFRGIRQHLSHTQGRPIDSNILKALAVQIKKVIGRHASAWSICLEPILGGVHKRMPAPLDQSASLSI